ncbi:hypothetical protein CL659_04975 [bacterium]|nr:hypothetical protein [bacterium]|tara:strand:+ start:5184 stop:5792 length:609 start_codon:yes stop_codon:yes gene_type:complete
MSRDWYILETVNRYEIQVGLSISCGIPNVESTTLDPEQDEAVKNIKYYEKLDKEQGALLENIIHRVEVPATSMKERGKVVVKRLYPKYVYIQMDHDAGTKNEIKAVVNNIYGVINLMGGWDHPQPLSEEEVQTLLKQIGEAQIIDSVEFAEGDLVRILEGAFQDYTGRVQDINLDKRLAGVTIPIFGKETRVEIDIDKMVAA